MVMTITEGEPPVPPEADSPYTPEFRELLVKMLAKDPAGRAGAMDLLEEPWCV